MRIVALLFALTSLVAAGDREPIRVTSRLVFTPNVCLPVTESPHCVTIDGIDYDVEPMLTEYRRAWYWPGNTEQSLRQHFATTHRTTGLESLTFTQLKKLHAVLHERELTAKLKFSQPPAMHAASPPSRCPGGVCPSPTAVGIRSRLFFRWR